jgi:hypothetical protein
MFSMTCGGVVSFILQTVGFDFGLIAATPRTSTLATSYKSSWLERGEGGNVNGQKEGVEVKVIRSSMKSHCNLSRRSATSLNHSQLFSNRIGT